MTLRFALLLLFIPGIAFAHPGHGHTEPTSWRHYLTEPVHVAIFVAIAAAIGGLVAVARRRRRQRRS